MASNKPKANAKTPPIPSASDALARERARRVEAAGGDTVTVPSTVGAIRTDIQSTVDTNTVLPAESQHPEYPQPRINAPEGSIAEMGSGVSLSGAHLVVDDSEPVVETIGERFPGPGETERGWSAEVTARHPEVLAENLREIMEEEGLLDEPAPHSKRGTARMEGYDPTDRASVEAALREISFHEQRKTDLINRAIKRGVDKLSAQEGIAAMAGPHAAMAAREVLAEIEGVAGPVRTD